MVNDCCDEEKWVRREANEKTYLRLDGCVIGRREDAFVSEHASTIGRSNFESFSFRISSLPAAPRHHKFEDCFRGGAEEINCS